MAPIAAMGVVGGNPALKEVAREADERLRRALKRPRGDWPKGGGLTMDYLIPIAVLVVWVLLNAWVLPRLGVPT